MKRPSPYFDYVYFIKPVGASGPFKIGHSHVPYERLNSMMNWSPVPLEIVAAVRGGAFEERAIHDGFADLHSHCEWFRADARLLEFVSKVKADGSLSAVLSGLNAVGCIRKGRRSVPKPSPAASPEQAA